MRKKPDLDDETVRIARNLLSTPPKPHEDMKLGKSKRESARSPKVKRKEKKRA